VAIQHRPGRHLTEKRGLRIVTVSYNSSLILSFTAYRRR
jgi:hypothetical protein